MKRRDLLKTMGLAATSLAIPKGLSAGKASQERFNVLIIHADEHRVDCLGSYGNHDIKTPHIDKLATDGVRYENSFCPFPVCTPSRYSMLSGMYVHEHRGSNNNSTLSPEIETFPKILRAAGYKTKAVGKMHFTPTYLDVGFDELVLSEQHGPGRWDDDYHRYLMHKGLVDRIDLVGERDLGKFVKPAYIETCGALISNLSEKYYSTTWIADHAMKTLQEWDNTVPNLLMVGFIKPHNPFDPPDPWHKKYDPKKLVVLPGWTKKHFDYDLKYNPHWRFFDVSLTETKLRQVMAFYYATISQIDFHVGRMIELLKKRRMYDNTLIIYTSDHGDYMGFHHMLGKNNYMYDPVVKVPLIIKWPNGERSGTISKQMVSNVDLAPTICQVAGCQPGLRMHGLDLGYVDADREIIFAEYGRDQDMARSHTRKLILTSPNCENLFFDLEEDPLEMKNLYNEPKYVAEIKRMERLLTVWRGNGKKPVAYIDHDAPQIQQSNVPPKDLSHRKAIKEYYREKMQAFYQGE